MEFKDYYSVLGLERSTSQEEIKRAYRKLARQYHPDTNQDAGAEERFKEINEAYEVLKDPDKRATYDRYGSAWESVREGGAPPPGYEDFFSAFSRAEDRSDHPFSSFFDLLFDESIPSYPGSAAPFDSHWRHRGTDFEARISLSLEEAARGGKRQFSLPNPLTGERKTYAVNFPAGIRPGRRLRLAGQGVQGGDLFLVADIQPHPRFSLEGRDLHTTWAVSPWVAALSGKAPLQTLDGEILVNIPPGSSSGRIIRLRGKGYPDPAGAGDLYARIDIAVPQKLSPQERKLFEKLAAVSDFEPAAA